jgi:hypothetical protein
MESYRRLPGADFNNPRRMEEYRSQQQEAADEKARDEKAEADIEDFIEAGRYAEAAAQPHLRYEQKKEAAKLKQKTESAENAKLQLAGDGESYEDARQEEVGSSGSQRPGQIPEDT